MIASSGQSHPCSGFMLRITPPSSMALGIHPITPTLCTHTPQQDLTHREQQTFERRQITDTHVPFRGNPKPVTMCTISTVLCVCVVSSQQRRQQNTSTYFLDSLVKQLQIKGAYPFASPHAALVAVFLVRGLGTRVRAGKFLSSGHCWTWSPIWCW